MGISKRYNYFYIACISNGKWCHGWVLFSKRKHYNVDQLEAICEGHERGGFQRKILAIAHKNQFGEGKVYKFWHGFSKDGHIFKLFALLLEESFHDLVLVSSFLL